MPDLPTLGEPTKKSPIPGVAVTALLVGLVAGGLYWWTHRPTAAPAPVPVPTAPVATAPVAAAPVQPAPTPVIAKAPAAPAPVAAVPGFKAFFVTLKGPVESAIVSQVGKETGTPLTQVVTRSLVWWLRVPQDLVKGDTLAAVYEERSGQEPIVHAVRLVSHKLGKTLEAYRYKPSSDPFFHFYQPDGSQLEEHLVDGPLDSYEQVTSLLRDGRRHKGVDFKTPVGTPVKATFDGVVSRKTWNFRSNGNSLEIAESGGKGRSALFLHLSEIEKSISVGGRVHKGQVVAKSGNTGHSFAPHLHYQLMKGDTLLDPFQEHKLERETLPAAEKPKLEVEIGKLKATFPSEPNAG